MSELGKFFIETGNSVDRTLDELLPTDKSEPKRLFEAMRWSVFAGGKRFRPALVFAVGQTFGADAEKLLRSAAAIEMIHTYSLIHDDLPAMDDDKLRRGRATCHIKFDEATAILAGDFLQNAAFQSIVEDEKLRLEIRLRLVAELASSTAKMICGQQLDLDAEGKNVSIEELETIHKNKTGAMICLSARAGAIIAEASEKQLNSVTNYASSLGLLFQITDDLLDLTQTTEVLGKTAGKDLTAEKSTYPAFYGLEETRKLARNVHAKAVESLQDIDKNTKLLKDLADFILSRKK